MKSRITTSAANLISAIVLVIIWAQRPDERPGLLGFVGGWLGLLLCVAIYAAVMGRVAARAAARDAAETTERLRRAMSRYAAPGESAYARDFNWDSPDTIAGQPR